MAEQQVMTEEQAKEWLGEVRKYWYRVAKDLYPVATDAQHRSIAVGLYFIDQRIKAEADDFTVYVAAVNRE